MPSIPLYVHADGAAHLHPQVPRRRIVMLFVFGACSIVLGVATAVVILLTPTDAPLKGMSLPLFMATVTFTGVFAAYRTATDPARLSARHHRYLSEETNHDH